MVVGLFCPEISHGSATVESLSKPGHRGIPRSSTRRNAPQQEEVNPQTRAMRQWSERERKPSVATDMEKVNLRLQVQDLRQQLEQKEQQMQAMTQRAKTAAAKSSAPAPDIVPVMTDEGNATAHRAASPKRVRHHHAGHHHHGGHHHHPQLPVRRCGVRERILPDLCVEGLACTSNGILHDLSIKGRCIPLGRHCTSLHFQVVRLVSDVAVGGRVSTISLRIDFGRITVLGQIAPKQDPQVQARAGREHASRVTTCT